MTDVTLVLFADDAGDLNGVVGLSVIGFVFGRTGTDANFWVIVGRFLRGFGKVRVPFNGFAAGGD